MNRIFVGLLGLLVSMGCFAQSNLRPCPKDQNAFWTNCYGSRSFPDGRKYVGEFKDDKFNGKGTFTMANGGKYVGQFKDGNIEGKGTVTFDDGVKLVGQFKDGNIQGQATYTLADGSKYVGEFRDGGVNGQATIYDAKGQIIESGLFENGKLVRSGQVDTTRPSNNQAISDHNNAQADSSSEKRQECYKKYNEWRATQTQKDQAVETLANAFLGTIFGSACSMLRISDQACKSAGVNPSPYDGELKKCVKAEQRDWQPICMGVNKATERCAPASNFESCMERLGMPRNAASRCQAIFGN